MPEIWTIAQPTDTDELDQVSLKLLHEGRQLARSLKVPLGIVLMASASPKLLQELEQSGADVAYACASPFPSAYTGEVYTGILSGLVQEYKPHLVLGANTSYGQEYLARTSHRTKGLYIQDSISIQALDTSTLRCIRLVLDGRFCETIELGLRPTVFISIRPGIIEPTPRVTTAPARLVMFEPDLKWFSNCVTLLSEIKASSDGADLAEAEIVVAGGRGVGTKEHWGLIEQLARTLGASIGGSRAAVDEGWIDYEQQIGYTGKRIVPKLYICCGISGSYYHSAGIKDAEHIIALNSDPGAEIFKIADLGLVGDLTETIPAFIQLIRQSGEEKHVSQNRI